MDGVTDIQVLPRTPCGTRIPPLEWGVNASTGNDTEVTHVHEPEGRSQPPGVHSSTGPSPTVVSWQS